MIAGLILAGGQARRMGGIDKPLLEIGGQPILSHLVERLRPQTSQLALSANGSHDRFAAFGLPILADRRSGIGPLAGVLRGLEWAETIGALWLLTVPGDTPLVPVDLVARLSPGPSMARSDGRTHPLVALWPVGCRTLLQAHLDAINPSGPRGAYGVRGFADRLAMRIVDFAAGDLDPFLNVNTPADFESLCAKSLRKRKIL